VESTQANNYSPEATTTLTLLALLPLIPLTLIHIPVEVFMTFLDEQQSGMGTACATVNKCQGIGKLLLG